MGAAVLPIALGAGSAIGGIGSGLISSSGARSVNSQSLDFARWAQKDAQQFNKDMYAQQLKDQENMYLKYQSPQAIAQQLMAAGLNPSSLAGKGFSGSSMPSIPSASGSSPVATPSLMNPGAGFAGAVQSVAQAMSSIGTAVNQSQQAKETQTLLGARLDGLLKDNASKEVYTRYQQFMLDLEKDTAHDKRFAEIENLIADSALKFSQNDLNGSLQALYEIQEKLVSNEYSMSSMKLLRYGELLNGVINLQQSEIGLNQQKAKTEITTRQQMRSVAALNNALAKTENSLRDGKIEMQNLQNDLLSIDKFIKGNEQKLSDATLQARIFGVCEQMYQQGLISENIYKEGQLLSTKVDWAGRQEFADYLGKIVGAATGVLNAYTNLRGVNLSRMTGLERNKIQNKIADEYIRQGKSQSDAKVRSTLGPDWEMYAPQWTNQ